MLTERSARLMNLKDYGVKVGNPADIVVLDATLPEQAVAEICHPLAVFKRGTRTVTRARAELHKPTVIASREATFRSSPGGSRATGAGLPGLTGLRLATTACASQSTAATPTNAAR